MLAALLAFLRFTRVGLVIRAGRGEPGDGHRARHRRAQGVHAGVRDRRRGGRAGRRARRGLLRLGLARPGRLAADLRVHRRGDRRDGLGGRVGVRRRGGRAACSSSSTTTARPALGDICVVGAARRSCCCCGRRASPEGWRPHDRRTGDVGRGDAARGRTARARARAALPPVPLRAAPRAGRGGEPAVLHGGHPGAVRRAAELAGHAAAARDLPGLRRSGGRLRPAVRPHRHALLRARAVLRGRRLRHRRSW